MVKQELLLTPEKIKALMPVKDGYTYYESFGGAIAQAQLAHSEPLIRKDEKERTYQQLIDVSTVNGCDFPPEIVSLTMTYDKWLELGFPDWQALKREDKDVE